MFRFCLGFFIDCFVSAYSVLIRCLYFFIDWIIHLRYSRFCLGCFSIFAIFCFVEICFFNPKFSVFLQFFCFVEQKGMSRKRWREFYYENLFFQSENFSFFQFFKKGNFEKRIFWKKAGLKKLTTIKGLRSNLFTHTNLPSSNLPLPMERTVPKPHAGRNTIRCIVPSRVRENHIKVTSFPI